MTTNTPLDKSTGISIGLVLMLMGMGAYHINWMAHVGAQLDVLDEKLSVITTDQWRGRDMETWATQLQELNKELHVPAVVRDQ